MKTSESVKEIIPALLKASESFKPAVKSADNPFHKSKYVPLDEVIAATKEALAENSLIVVQGGMPLVTRIFHTSGEWIETTLDTPLGKQDPQGLGSAMTYSRRYSLMAILGIAPENDDDGEGARVPQTTTLNGEKHVKSGNGWERAPELQDEAAALVKELQGLRSLAGLSAKEAEALTGVRWTVGLPVLKLGGLVDQLQDFIDRKESGNLTSEELIIIGAKEAA